MGVDGCEKKGGEWVWYGTAGERRRGGMTVIGQWPMHINCHKKSEVKREEMLDFFTADKVKA